MIGHQMPFQNLAILLFGKGMEDPTQTGTDLTVQPLLTTLRDEDQVVTYNPILNELDYDSLRTLTYGFSFQRGNHTCIIGRANARPIMFFWGTEERSNLV